MLNVALHRCKDACSDAYQGPDGTQPFARVTVEDGNGGRVHLYFNDLSSIESLAEAAINAHRELIEEIDLYDLAQDLADIAAEESDKAERRGVK